MQKMFFIFLIALIAGISITAAAQRPGEYIRKQLKPSFFIPEKELDSTEKLPEFNYYPEEEKKPLKAEILEISDEVDMTSELPEDTATSSLPAPLNAEKPKIVESEYLKYSKEELASLPEYKQKYDDYVSDLKIIAETGKTPENKRLAEDLAKMSTNNRIIVDESFGLKPLNEDINPTALSEEVY